MRTACNNPHAALRSEFYPIEQGTPSIVMSISMIQPSPHSMSELGGYSVNNCTFLPPDLSDVDIDYDSI
jgi:hypothetical protein